MRGAGSSIRMREFSIPGPGQSARGADASLWSPREPEFEAAARPAHDIAQHASCPHSIHFPRRGIIISAPAPLMEWVLHMAQAARRAGWQDPDRRCAGTSLPPMRNAAASALPR